MKFKKYLSLVVFTLLFRMAGGQTFPCDNGARLYFFLDTLGTNGALAYIENYTTVPTITAMCPMPSMAHNGLGANPIDHYLYYLNGSKLERLDANCTMTQVCTLASGSL